MALTLDATLLAAQNSTVRKPLIEIISSDASADIPFDGQLLTTESSNEQGSNVIVHSSGRIIVAYRFGTTQIKYIYTDTERLSFSFVTINVGQTVAEVALCELVDGNVGILYRTVSGSNQYLKYRTVSVDGTLIASGDIVSYGGTPTITGPCVIRLADDSYLAVFVRLVSGDYTFYQITSTNFTTWNSPSSMSVGGLTLTNEIANPYLHREINGGDLFLFFDYANLTNTSNIYYSISTNGGSSWSSAAQITSYASAASRAAHPVSAQKIANQLFVFFNEQSSALHMNSGSEPDWEGPNHGFSLTFDPVSRKLYQSSDSAVNEIDVDTWAWTKGWSDTTTPAFPPGLNTTINQAQGEGRLIPLFATSGHGYISLLNAENDTITNYIFQDFPAYGLIQNVNHDLPQGGILAVKVDLTARRLYILMHHSVWPGWATWYRFGYLDLTEPGPLYNYYEIIPPTHLPDPAIGNWSQYGFRVYPGQDMIIIWNSTTLFTTNNPSIAIHHLSTGELIKMYQHTETFPSFPYYGFRNACLIGTKLYGSFPYYALYGEEDKRGLCEIDILTDTVRFIRPTWDTLDEYSLKHMYPLPDGRIVILSTGNGVTIFNPSDETWILYNNANLPGLDPAFWSIYNFASLAHDETSGLVFLGWHHNVFGDWEGIGAFSVYGFLKQSLYAVGTYSGGSLNFGAINDAVVGYQDYDMSAVFGPEATDGLFVFWTNKLSSEYSIKWDKEGMVLNLSSYLARGKEISIRRSIDGRPNELRFTISNGHLFDPDNFASLLAPILEKGREVNVRIGENIGGADYWADQGTFMVSDVKMKYGRGQYPEMEIMCLDRRATWDYRQIYATPYYDEGDPKLVLTDIATDFLYFSEDEIDLPDFDNARPITQQWMESLPRDIIGQICNRFGYYPRITVDDKLSARKISNVNTVDHVYSDLTKIVEYTPDDSFSDFTNQIVVVGHELNEIEIVYEEERIETLSGTIGWWSGRQEFTVYFSKDMSRRCRNPRLEVIQSTNSAPFEIGGRLSESISYVDPNECYCVVSVVGPDLMPMLMAVMASIVASYFIGDAVFTVGVGGSGGWTKPVGTLIQMIGINLAIGILGSICTFQYEIWARPLGKIRRSIQGQWDDFELQNKIQQVISQKIEEPLCNSAPDCVAMANQEGLETQLQRRRRRFSKITHLQDEDGDTIQFPHPYTSQALKIFVTDLTRKMLIPAKDGEDGSLMDEIEGWRL